MGEIVAPCDLLMDYSGENGILACNYSPSQCAFREGTDVSSCGRKAGSFWLPTASKLGRKREMLATKIRKINQNG